MPDASNGYMRAAALGVVAGLRSMTPLALLSAAASLPDPDHAFGARSALPLSLLQSPATLRLSVLAGAGELVGDKLPFVPSRLAAPVFGWRLAVGAAAGAAVCDDAGLPLAPGAALGAAGAALGSAAGYRARTALARSTSLPDPVWALVEDAVAVGLGAFVLRRYLLASTP